MEIFILKNLLIGRHKRNVYCLENLSVFQSVDIPWTGYFAVECHGRFVLFLIEEEAPLVKWRLLLRGKKIAKFQGLTFANDQ